jgi:hypothetical protein
VKSDHADFLFLLPHTEPSLRSARGMDEDPMSELIASQAREAASRAQSHVTQLEIALGQLEHIAIAQAVSHKDALLTILRLLDANQNAECKDYVQLLLGDVVRQENQPRWKGTLRPLK